MAKPELSELDLTRSFLPEALAGLPISRALDEDDARRLNQIRAFGYLQLFDRFESVLSSTAHARSRFDLETRDVLAPLLRLDAFDHHELFEAFEVALERAFPVPLRALPVQPGLVRTCEVAAPHALLVLALHLKLVTQQHYLACVRGAESLEPHFVKLLREHWTMECGASRTSGSALSIQNALSKTTPGRVPAALRDYRLLVFACDDVLAAQAALDVEILEELRGALAPSARSAVVASELASLRKTFLTVGIVNAAFVYAMRSLGPTAPATLAGVVSALASRR